MAARSHMIGRRAAIAAATLSGSAILAAPKRSLLAETPPSDLEFKRKPIYDDFSSNITSSAKPKTSDQLPPSTPRPTDRLAKQIGHVRLFLHRQASASEDWLNSVLARGFDLESSFTRTVVNLAPDPATGERVLPGALYVAVATMAGSILVRRRNILLRTATPLAAGIGAGWILIPYTMRNVSDLVWEYEEKVPVIALNHMRVRGFVEQSWKEARERGLKFGEWTEERAADARIAVEGWVKKGR